MLQGRIQGHFIHAIFCCCLFIILSGSDVNIIDSKVSEQAAQPGEIQLFFSEYVEGSSFNKCLEIFNPAEETVFLDSLIVQFFINGSEEAGNTITLSGTIEGRTVYVLCDDGADEQLVEIADLLFSGIAFNGDDAILLLHGQDTLDVIGRIGEDPGSQWGSGLTSTANNTLIRLPHIYHGDSWGYDGFDPSVEWEGYPMDHFTDLGTHFFVPPNDCDSLVATTFFASICEGESFVFGSHQLTSTGIYGDTLISQTTGCDSIVSVQLTVYDTLGIGQVFVEYCSSGPILINLHRIMEEFTGAPATFTFHQLDAITHGALFFSEYLEGTGQNKCLEIYNGAAENIDLEDEDIQIEFYFNGAEIPGRIIDLKGLVSPGETYVLCREGGDTSLVVLADTLIGGTFFNGDDAVLISSHGRPLDVIGRIGEDPGSEWLSGGISTRNRTLIRKSHLLLGDTIATDPFEPSAQWEGWPTDYRDNLGQHLVHIPANPVLVARPDSVWISDHSIFEVTLTDTTTLCSSVAKLEIVIAPVPELIPVRIENTCPTKYITIDEIREQYDSIFTPEVVISLHRKPVEAFKGTADIEKDSFYTDTRLYVRAEEGLCFDTSHVNLLISSCPENCRIELRAIAAQCRSDGTYDVTVDFESSDPLSDSVDIRTAGENILSARIWPGVNHLRWYPDSLATDTILQWVHIIDKGSGGITLSEIHADPDPIFGDANKDGVVSPRDDEFLELYNNSNVTLDISGFQLFDGTGLIHEFPRGTTMPPYNLLVVFGGGEITDDGHFLAQKASNGGLSLNNSGDLIVLTDEQGDPVFSVSYGFEASHGESLVNVGADVFRRISLSGEGDFHSVGTVTGGNHAAGEGYAGFYCVDSSLLRIDPCPVLDTFDLALLLTRTGQGPVNPAETVSSIVSVYNQGNVTAYDVEVLTQAYPINEGPSSLPTNDSMHHLLIIDSLLAGEVFEYRSVLSLLLQDLTRDTYIELSGEVVAGRVQKGSPGIDKDGVLELRGGGPDEITGVLEDNLYGEAQDDYDFLRIPLCKGLAIPPPAVRSALYCQEETMPDSVTMEIMAFQPLENLFISGYLEGRAFDKCLEIYNATGRVLDLADYSVEIYQNGSLQPTRRAALHGFLPDGKSALVCHPSVSNTSESAAIIYSESVGVFNGNDVVVLNHKGRVIDAIGQIGVDAHFARDVCLVRKPMIRDGDTHPYDLFDVTTDWLVDSCGPADLGQHRVDLLPVDSFRLTNVDESGYEEKSWKVASIFALPTPRDFTVERYTISSLWGECNGAEGYFSVGQHGEYSGIACADEVHMTPNDTCGINLDPAIFVDRPGYVEFYTVELRMPSGNGLIDPSNHEFKPGERYKYLLTDVCTGHACTGGIRIIGDFEPQVSSCPCQAETSLEDPECILDCAGQMAYPLPEFFVPCGATGDKIMSTEELNISAYGEKIRSVLWKTTSGDTLCRQQFREFVPSVHEIVPPPDTLVLTCSTSLSSDTVHVGEPGVVRYDGSQVSVYAYTGCNFDVRWKWLHEDTICAGSGRKFREWVVFDRTSGETWADTQLVLWEDSVRPDVSSWRLKDERWIASVQGRVQRIEVTDPFSCLARWELPEIIGVVDECSQPNQLLYSVVTEGEDPLIRDQKTGVYLLPVGLHRIRIQVADPCGNYSFFTLVVIVTDRLPPQVLCKDRIRVNMNGSGTEGTEGWVSVPIDALVPADQKECGKELLIFGRRTDTGRRCTRPGLRSFSTEAIDFCCGDIGELVEVEMTFYDAAGNQSTCITEVEVHWEPPECPDYTLSCQSYLLEGVDCTGQAGCTPDKCVVLYEDISGCGNGEVWVEHRWGGRYACQQTVLIQNTEAFNPGSIRWPVHIQINGNARDSLCKSSTINITKFKDSAVCCQGRRKVVPGVPGDRFWGELYSADAQIANPGFFMDDLEACPGFDTGNPAWPVSSCHMVSASHRDTVTTCDPGCCYTIARTWTVVDWCAGMGPESHVAEDPVILFTSDDAQGEHYVLDTSQLINDGIYRYVQYIDVVNVPVGQVGTDTLNDLIVQLVDCNRAPLEGVTLSLNYPDSPSISLMTDGGGLVELSGSAKYLFVDKWSMRAEWDNFPDDAVTVRDHNALSSHLLGRKVISDRVALAAADVDGNGRVDARDLVALQKMLLDSSGLVLKVLPLSSWQDQDPSDTLYFAVLVVGDVDLSSCGEIRNENEILKGDKREHGLDPKMKNLQQMGYPDLTSSWSWQPYENSSNEVLQRQELTVFPNPFLNSFSVSTDSVIHKTARVVLIDQIGKVYHPGIQRWGPTRLKIELQEGLPGGMYWLLIENGNRREILPVVKM